MLVAVAVALPVVAICLPSSALASAPGAEADGLKRGVRLIAKMSLTLKQARINKGSRVTVVHVKRQHGMTVAVSVELKDGHVLRNVPIATIKRGFKLSK